MTNNPDGLSDAREAVAQIIDPDAFATYPFDPDRCEDFIASIEQAAEDALAKADAILALTPPASTSTAIAVGEAFEQAAQIADASRCEVIGVTSAAQDWTAKTIAEDIRGLAAAAPKAASEVGATGLLREALVKARDLLMNIAQAPANIWYVATDDPEMTVSDTYSAIDAALAASPTDATGAGVMLEQAALIAESYEPMGYMSDREREYCRDHGQEIADRIRIHAHSVSLPVAGETL